MEFEWRTLKSGSDLRGVAMAGEKPVTLSPDAARQASAAFAQLLGKARAADRPLTVAVGHDSRLTGPALAAACREGLCSQGCRVWDVGLCTTPAMFMTTRHPATACDGAIMVTASHLPAERNGLKFFGPQGGLDGKDMDRLLALCETLAAVACDDQSRPLSFLPLYCQHLGGLVQEALGAGEPLKGLRIVVDAGNGAGGFYADWLRSLGADTRGSIYLEPDGRFPGHAPNPENDQAMAALSQAVRRSQADLGVIFDADCDRAALVDGDGKPIHRDRLIALCSAMVLSDHKGATIVTDSVTSTGLTRFIEDMGGVHFRYMRGYRNVIDKALCLNQQGIDCPLAMETSGHGALRDNYFLDDGMYLVTRLLIDSVRRNREGRAWLDVLSRLKEPLEEKEIRIPIGGDVQAVGRAALEAVLAWLPQQTGYHRAPQDYEGIRCETDKGDGWFLLRSSLHDPLLVWNAQSDRQGGVATMAEDLRRILKDVQGLTLPKQ